MSGMAKPSPAQSESAKNQQQTPIIIGAGFVKGVLSGDTLVISPNATLENPRPDEFVVSLTDITSPKLAFVKYSGPMGKSQFKYEDEPWSWAAREFLRKHVGSRVAFKLTNKYNNIHYGHITSLDQSGKLGIDFRNLINGWATVRRKTTRYRTEVTRIDGYDEVQTTKIPTFVDPNPLIAIEEDAKARGVGMWNSDTTGSTREIIGYNYSPLDIFKAYKGTPIDALVENVRSSTQFDLILFPQHQYIRVNLVGLRGQGWKVDPTTKKYKPEPYAEESRFFVEQNLLNRIVKVTINSFQMPKSKDSPPMFFASLTHPDIDISSELLTNGLVFISARAAEELSPQELKRLRTCENMAKVNSRKIWKNYKSPASSGPKMTKIGIVADVLTGSKLSIAFHNNPKIAPKTSNIILDSEYWSTESIFLSSIYTPRVTSRKPEQSEPYGMESYENLCDFAIGKRVKVDYEFNLNDKQYASVWLLDPLVPRLSPLSVQARRKKPSKPFTLSGVDISKPPLNLALLQIASGYARAVNHKLNESRSMDYDSLIRIQKQMIEQGKKGLFSKAASPSSDSSSKGKKKSRKTQSKHTGSKYTEIASFKDATLRLSSLQNAGKIEGIVEHCFNAARFKLRLPKHNLIILFCLSNVWVPRSIKSGSTVQSEPFQESGTSFVKSLILKRKVLVSFSGVDKGGSFQGALHFARTMNAGKVGLLDLTEEILRNGFGKLWSKVPSGSNLSIAESHAMTNGIRVWSKSEEIFPSLAKRVASRKARELEDAERDAKRAEIERKRQAAAAAVEEAKLAQSQDPVPSSSSSQPPQNPSGPSPLVVSNVEATGDIYSAKIDPNSSSVRFQRPVHKKSPKGNRGGKQSNRGNYRGGRNRGGKQSNRGNYRGGQQGQGRNNSKNRNRKGNQNRGPKSPNHSPASSPTQDPQHISTSTSRQPKSGVNLIDPTLSPDLVAQMMNLQ